MKTTYWILGSLAAGTALGLLLAPRKGSDTRKMIGKMPTDVLDTFKYKLYQLSDMLSKVKDETENAAQKVVYKTHSMVNEAKSTN